MRFLCKIIRHREKSWLARANEAETRASQAEARADEAAGELDYRTLELNLLIRDVVRDAISDGDMEGNIEHDFIMSDDGREILDKAPIPKGWEAYKDAAEMRPVVNGLPSAMPVPMHRGDATPQQAKTQHVDTMPGFLNPQPSPSRAQD